MTAMARSAPTPVTVIGGFLGAGKTTLLNALIRHGTGRRLGVLVNDFGAINIVDPTAARGRNHAIHTSAQVGCGRVWPYHPST